MMDINPSRHQRRLGAALRLQSNGSGPMLRPHSVLPNWATEKKPQERPNLAVYLLSADRAAPEWRSSARFPDGIKSFNIKGL